MNLIIFTLIILLKYIKTKDFIEEHKSSLSLLHSITSKLNELSIALFQITSRKNNSNQTLFVENIELNVLKKEKQLIKKDIFSYDIANRLIMEQSLKYNSSIDKYEFLYYKPIAKHDSGAFTQILIITALNDTLYFNDVYMNQIFNLKLNYSIRELITFKQIDESDIYILNKNRTILSKYSFVSQKHENKVINDVIDKITIKTFKENKNNEDEDNKIYDLFYNYKSSLQKIAFNLVLRDHFSIYNNSNDSNRNINDTIEIITPILTKGLKTINIITQNRHLYKIKAITFEIIHHFVLDNNNILNQLNNLNPLPMLFMNFYSFISMNNSIFINSFDKSLSVECINHSMKSATINNYYFDSVYHLLFIIDEEGNLFYSFPNIFGHIKASCDVYFLFKLKITAVSKYQMNMLRKDLLISNEYNEYVFINFEEVEWNDAKSFNRFKIKQIQFPRSEGYLSSQSKIIKTSMEHYLMIRSSENEVLLYHIPNINGKLKGNEEIGFNFKVPVIFIALIVIFFVNYYKKKQGNNISSEAFRGEIMNELKKYGRGMKQKRDKEFKRE